MWRGDIENLMTCEIRREGKQEGAAGLAQAGYMPRDGESRSLPFRRHSESPDRGNPTTSGSRRLEMVIHSKRRAKASACCSSTHLERL